MKYLFGPVNSRRLGISLGVDLIPYKTCSLNCIYCECGKTTSQTTEVKEYVPTADVINELSVFLASNPDLDIITFAGSGEPTLHSGIGDIIAFLKTNFPEYKVSVLTNGTLLNRKEIRQSILKTDIIIPSLDGASDAVFRKITRPIDDISAADVIHGLTDLRKEFRNTIILEIFIASGINDNEKELGLIKSACLDIAPDMIQLNTLDRPGTEDWVTASTENELLKIKQFFLPLKTEIITRPSNRDTSRGIESIDISDKILSTISRRPSTLQDLNNSLNISQKDILKILKKLLNEGIIKEEIISSGTFYKLKI